jgi:sphingomyelin phosphodiesterase
LWSTWLPENTSDTIIQGGYYTTLIRPGLRLIALNNNYCFIYNWWLLYDESPYINQFQWLHDTLLEAEEAGEKVHIITHIPNGISEMYDSCSEEYQKVINRFHRTIKAQFTGHVEFLNFNLFFSKKKKSKPINVAFNGGSLTTFSENNRNYVLYKVDPNSFVSIFLLF